MNKKIKLIMITTTLILSLLLINQMKYRNNELYAVNLKNKIDKNLVSILVSDGSENYTKYEGSTFPSNTEYTYNSELSRCQDHNGNVIEGILSYNDESGKVNIRTKKTTSCYLYFDKKATITITGGSGSFSEVTLKISSLTFEPSDAVISKYYVIYKDITQNKVSPLFEYNSMPIETFGYDNNSFYQCPQDTVSALIYVVDENNVESNTFEIPLKRYGDLWVCDMGPVL